MIYDMFHIEGKKAIVTGGSRGIGRGIAKGLHDAGCQVVIWGSSATVRQTAEELSTDDNLVEAVICDLNRTETIEQAFEASMAHLGGEIDILINNAGTQIRHKCEEFPLEDFNKVLRVNLIAAFLLSQLAGKKMLQKGYGKIVNTASMTSFSGGFTVPAYTASKGGIAQLTKAFCNEWAGRGINVNAIAPGYIDTDNLIGLNEARMRTIMDRLPAGRLGTPEDLIGIVLFLCSHASDYLNGAIIPVDGGWLAR